MVALAQLEGFLETARHENLSRAAEALHVTQPALTARLKGLEHELGVVLFDRSRRGMRLTAAGAAYLSFVERALLAIEEGRVTLERHAIGEAGHLVIGSAPAVGAYVLPALLERFVMRFPRVRLSVQTGHSEEIALGVVAGELDVGLIRELHRSGLRSRVLYEDELVLVVPPGHDFATSPKVDVVRLSEATLILFDRQSSYYELTNASFRAAGVAPRGTLAVDNIEAAKQMVRHGLGVALLPHTAIAGDVARGSLIAVELRGTIPIRRRIIAVMRAGSPSTAARDGFDHVLESIHEVLPDRDSILR